MFVYELTRESFVLKIESVTLFLLPAVRKARDEAISFQLVPGGSEFRTSVVLFRSENLAHVSGFTFGLGWSEIERFLKCIWTLGRRLKLCFLRTRQLVSALSPWFLSSEGRKTRLRSKFGRNKEIHDHTNENAELLGQGTSGCSPGIKYWQLTNNFWNNEKVAYGV